MLRRNHVWVAADSADEPVASVVAIRAGAGAADETGPGHPRPQGDPPYASRTPALSNPNSSSPTISRYTTNP
jgi:hypothetical protein